MRVYLGEAEFRALVAGDLVKVANLEIRLSDIRWDRLQQAVLDVFEHGGGVGPGFWMNETSGILRPAVEAYLGGKPLTVAHIGALRAYFRQWAGSSCWDPSDELETLRVGIDDLTSREAIQEWLDDALELGIDPL